MTRVDPQPAPGATAAARPRARGTTEFILLLVGAEVSRHVDHPLRGAGVLFAGAAMGLGIWLLSRRNESRPRRRTWLLAVALAMACFLLIWHVAMLAVRPLIGDYERCTDQALTREAAQSCQDDLRERLGSLRPG